LVEHQLWELAVAGSNPVAPTIFFSSPGANYSQGYSQVSALAIILLRAQKETGKTV
jgi:hypothetical protein